MTERVWMPVEGMTCISCVGHVTGALRKIDGVERVRVDLATDSAIVAFDPSRTSLAAIGEAVDRVGYHARTEQATPVPEGERRSLLSRFKLARR